MGANELIGLLALAGVQLSMDGEQLNAEACAPLTDELRALIRDNKPALLAALTPTDRGIELRRQRVLQKLASEPDRQRVAIFDTDAEQDFVICTVAIRDVGTCELRIPADQYDPWAILAALEQTQ